MKMTSRRRRMHPVSDCLFVREFTLIGLHRFTAQGRSIWMLFKLRSISCTKRDSQNAMRAQRILIILPVQMRAPPRTSLALSNDRRVCSFSAYLAGTSLTTPRKRPTTGHMDHHLPKVNCRVEIMFKSVARRVRFRSSSAACLEMPQIAHSHDGDCSRARWISPGAGAAHVGRRYFGLSPHCNACSA